MVKLLETWYKNDSDASTLIADLHPLEDKSPLQTLHQLACQSLEEWESNRLALLFKRHLCLSECWLMFRHQSTSFQSKALLIPRSRWQEARSLGSKDLWCTVVQTFQMSRRARYTLSTFKTPTKTQNKKDQTQSRSTLSKGLLDLKSHQEVWIQVFSNTVRCDANEECQ